MLRKTLLGLGLLVLASLALAQVSVKDRWRYTPFAQKDAVTAERLLRYTFAAAGERLRFEVRVDGRVVARFAKRARGELVFVVRLEPKPLRDSGLVVARSVVQLEKERQYTVLAKTTKREATRTITQTYVSEPEDPPDVITRTQARRGDRIISKTQVSGQEPGTLVDVAIELPFAGVRAPATLTPRLAMSAELEVGQRYELLTGRWGEGHALAVYVTPLAD